MNTSHESELLHALKDRAHMLFCARTFFFQRQVLEVDCPALLPEAPIDPFIDVMQVILPGGKRGYLHTSPEYGMKRLLSLGLGDIYQLSHVFREGEIGPLHNPEFTMCEWYRIGYSLDALIQETLAFIHLFLSELPCVTISYREALKKYASIDYLEATIEELLSCAHKHSLHLPPDASGWDKDTLLQLLMSFIVEPHLGQDQLCVLIDYPASQAALAQTKIKGCEHVAERFEIYYKGIELANGYHELLDPIEQEKRLADSEKKRKEMGKEPLPVDRHFLEALKKGLPDCSGVAVGFDRLLMLRRQASSLKSILPFTWEVEFLAD